MEDISSVNLLPPLPNHAENHQLPPPIFPHLKAKVTLGHTTNPTQAGCQQYRRRWWKKTARLLLDCSFHLASFMCMGLSTLFHRHLLQANAFLLWLHKSPSSKQTQSGWFFSGSFLETNEASLWVPAVRFRGWTRIKAGDSMDIAPVLLFKIPRAQSLGFDEMTGGTGPTDKDTPPWRRTFCTWK